MLPVVGQYTPSARLRLPSILVREGLFSSPSHACGPGPRLNPEWCPQPFPRRQPSCSTRPPLFVLPQGAPGRLSLSALSPPTGRTPTWHPHVHISTQRVSTWMSRAPRPPALLAAKPPGRSEAQKPQAFRHPARSASRGPRCPHPSRATGHSPRVAGLRAAAQPALPALRAHVSR